MWFRWFLFIDRRDWMIIPSSWWWRISNENWCRKDKAIFIPSFRLFAFDNDYLSYTDVNLEEALVKPILMITNPPVGIARLLYCRTLSWYRPSNIWSIYIRLISFMCLCMMWVTTARSMWTDFQSRSTGFNSTPTSPYHQQTIISSISRGIQLNMERVFILSLSNMITDIMLHPSLNLSSLPIKLRLKYHPPIPLFPSSLFSHLWILEPSQGVSFSNPPLFRSSLHSPILEVCYW